MKHYTFLFFCIFLNIILLSNMSYSAKKEGLDSLTFIDHGERCFEPFSNEQKYAAVNNETLEAYKKDDVSKIVFYHLKARTEKWSKRGDARGTGLLSFILLPITGPIAIYQCVMSNRWRKLEKRTGEYLTEKLGKENLDTIRIGLGYHQSQDISKILDILKEEGFNANSYKALMWESVKERQKIENADYSSPYASVLL